MNDNSTRRCYNCRFFATKDQGWSNYTVEETIAHCLHRVHPLLPSQESYSWRYSEELKAWDVAESCPFFQMGDGIKLDVEGETSIKDYADVPDLFALANGYPWWGESLPLKDRRNDDRPVTVAWVDTCGASPTEGQAKED